MKNTLIVSLIISTTLFPYVVVCSEISELNGQQLHEQINMLEVKINQAANKMSLWRDTEKLLSQAKQELADNKLQDTKDLIEQVESQLSLGFEQAQQQSDINSLVPYYLK